MKTYQLFFILILIQQIVCTKQHKTFMSSWESKAQGDVYWMEQQLDHFNQNNKQTFPQRYYINSTWYNPGVGPVLLFLGGEGPLTSKWVQGGMLMDLAEKYQGLAVALEHRYYGESQPFPELPSENLKWLSSYQALGDVALFYEEISSAFSLDKSKTTWISFGCSYSGALSLWLREKYPHIIDGAYSGSSPVLATKKYVEYDETVQDAVGYSCLTHLTYAFDEIQKKIVTSEGKAELEKAFATCQPLDDDYYVKMFKYNVIGVLQDSVQYNNAPKGFPRVEMCKRLAQAKDKYEEYVKLTVEYNGGQCMDLSLNGLLNQTAAPENNYRTWWWQKATEFGYYKISPQNTALFFPEIDEEFHNQIADEIFEQPLKPDVDFTNNYYGAKNPDVSNVIITNGYYDPWSRLSILNDLPSGVQSVLYTSSGHCAPVYPVIKEGPDSTPEDVLLAIQKVSDFVGDVIKQKS